MQFSMLRYLLILAALLFATALDDMVIDNFALLMPKSAKFGRAINGVAFQTQPLMSFGGFQFAAWYHRGATGETIYLGRRKLSRSTWQSFDTRIRFINGAGPKWNAHNVISMGISAEGMIHLAYDMHAKTLRYATSIAGAANSSTWTSSIMKAERSSLDIGDNPLRGVTYPRFFRLGKGQLMMTYRKGTSGNGHVVMTIYNSTSGRWGRARTIINGNIGKYTDILGSSAERNAYMNGISRGQDGTLHMTWTWRETKSGANHDIMYAYSKDDGRTWRNNLGSVVGRFGAPIHLNSQRIVIARLDRRQTLMNDQSQAVDHHGGVHVLMWHRRFDETGHKWRPGDPPFFTSDAAYYHYYRNPSTRTWTRKQLPTSKNVGSRPQIAVDSDGNLFAVYTSPDVFPRNHSIYADGKVVVAGCRRRANNGYANWEILSSGYRLYSGEPLIDRARLFNDGILSIFVQRASLQSGPTGSPLHVFEFNMQSVYRR